MALLIDCISTEVDIESREDSAIIGIPLGYGRLGNGLSAVRSILGFVDTVCVRG